MQAVCDILEQLVRNGTLAQYAIGGATAAGFHGEPLATRVIDVFVFLEPPPDSFASLWTHCIPDLAKWASRNLTKKGC